MKCPVLKLSWLKCQIIMNFSSRWQFLQNRRGNLKLVVTKLGECVALSCNIIMSSRFVSTKLGIVLAQAREVPGTSLKIKAICNF